MRILKVEFKNFASYGNKMHVLEFTKDSADFYQVLGNNGVGKTSLAKVMTYLCYGKVEGVNLKDLPNRVNKNLWGKIYLESKGNSIIIERGINPGVLGVSINGVDYDVAGKSNVQDYLESELFEIPYHVFKNIIILSINDFKSFITMSPHDKKQIVDKIFGFSIFNQMRDIVKSNRRQISELIKSYDSEIRTINESIKSIESKINSIEKINTQKSNDRIEKLRIKVDKLKINKDKLIEAKLKVKEKYEKFNQVLTTQKITETDLKYQILNLKKELDLYKNDKCPTCESPLTDEFHVHLKTEKEGQVKLLASNYKDIKIEIEATQQNINNLKSKTEEISEKTYEIENAIKIMFSEIQKLSSADNTDVAQFNTLVKEFNAKQEKKATSKMVAESDENYYSIIENLLGEDGIKNLAVKSILPSLNNNILIMSKEIGIPFNIKFDEKFNCLILHLGEDISPKTLSAGERKKIDFVIIMAMIKMIKMRFPSINILFLDEIFSSIDPDGVYHIISILSKMIKEIGLNAFVINHTVLPSEMFDKKIEISKSSGFSDFIIDKLD